MFIDCDIKPGHDWAAFSCWYSLYKNLPDAHTILAVRRANPLDIFRWAITLRVRRLHHVNPDFCGLAAEMEDHMCLVVKPSVLLVGDLDVAKLDRPLTACSGQVRLCLPGEPEEVPWLCRQAKDEEPSPFVSFSDGLASFVMGDWINTSDCPFPRAPRLLRSAASCNEAKVLRLWQQMGVLYPNIAR